VHSRKKVVYYDMLQSKNAVIHQVIFSSNNSPDVTLFSAIDFVDNIRGYSVGTQ